MKTVLVSFIGVGRQPREGATVISVSKSGYERALYQFPAEQGFPTENLESTIFGSILLKRLRRLNRSVSRWLIMGTAQSVWNDLIEMFSEEEQTNLLDDWNKVDDALKGKADPIRQELLDKWQAALTREMKDTEVLCRLVGAGDTPESQERIYQSILDAAQTGDEIVLDITHGFRHQPVLASFMVMLLRWLREVKQVDVYNGALELGGKVLKLDSCSELLEAIEAIAIYEKTGNYRQIGEKLNLSQSFNSRLEYLAFTGETLKPRKEIAGHLHNECLNQIDTLDPIKKSLAERLCDALAWGNEPSFALVWKRKAQIEFQREQYFKAIALLWEAVLIAECEASGIGNILDRSARKNADERLQTRLKKNAQKNNIWKEPKNNFWRLKNLRNAVLHGTGTDDEKVKKALDSLKDFKDIFDKGLDLFDEVISKKI
jgi:cell division protein DivIC